MKKEKDNKARRLYSRLAKAKTEKEKEYIKRKIQEHFTSS